MVIGDSLEVYQGYISDNLGLADLMLLSISLIAIPLTITHISLSMIP